MRRIRLDGVIWNVWDAGRVQSGLGLAWFAPAKGDGAASATESTAGAGGVEDRRALLQPDHDLSTMDGETLAELWENSRPLTPTERRITGPDGEVWLAQGTGPAWADARAAREILGVRLRCISHRHQPLSKDGVTLGELSDDDLRDWIARARHDSGTCSD